VSIKTVRTDVLTICYDSGGPENGSPVLLLHGWPDDVRGWRGIVPYLEAEGFRWYAPWLRGFGGTVFNSAETIRDGTAAALAQDAFDFADALGLKLFSVVGHDWGGRAGYFMAALQPGRLIAMACLAIGYAPRGTFSVPDFAQAQRWWYQWFATIEGGAEAIRRDPVGFARIQWNTWSPIGWFDELEFASTAESFLNPEWVAITLNGYRSRWRPELLDPRYDAARQAVALVELLTVPTLFIGGTEDRCDPPSESEGDASYFVGGYRRLILDGVGHFPAREAPDDVARALLQQFDNTRRSSSAKPLPVISL
jgi:pimeloyl-ACP methyl ester carboxylesterase